MENSPYSCVLCCVLYVLQRIYFLTACIICHIMKGSEAGEILGQAVYIISSGLVQSEADPGMN